MYLLAHFEYNETESENAHSEESDSVNSFLLQQTFTCELYTSLDLHAG